MFQSQYRCFRVYIVVLVSGTVAQTFCRYFRAWNGGAEIITPFQRLEFCGNLSATVLEVLFLKNFGGVKHGSQKSEVRIQKSGSRTQSISLPVLTSVFSVSLW